MGAVLRPRVLCLVYRSVTLLILPLLRDVIHSCHRKQRMRMRIELLPAKPRLWRQA